MQEKSSYAGSQLSRKTFPKRAFISHDRAHAVYTQNKSRLTVWSDRTEHSAALAPGEEEGIVVHYRYMQPSCMLLGLLVLLLLLVVMWLLAWLVTGLLCPSMIHLALQHISDTLPPEEGTHTEVRLMSVKAMAFYKFYKCYKFVNILCNK